MNAAGQRRLTPVLGLLCALAVLLLGALVLGLGRGVHWGAAAAAAPIPAADSVSRHAPPPLQSFADVWREPLFNTDRKPAPETGNGNENVTLGNLQLTGIIITPDLRMALLHDPSGTDVRVREGQELADTGWTLVELAPHSAVFGRNGQRIRLQLKVAGSDQSRATAPTFRQGEGAALWMRRHSGKQQKAPPKAVHDATGQGAQDQRIRELKERIDSRRRQSQAQREREH